MDINYFFDYRPKGLVILIGSGYFSSRDRTQFLRGIKRLSSDPKPRAIAYEFSRLSNITPAGIDCMLRAHESLDPLLIEDYLLIPTNRSVGEAMVKTGANHMIYFGNLDKIIRRINSPLPKEQQSLAEAQRTRLGLRV